MAYIKRDIEDKILALSKEYSCILITGPHQVGKTTVLKQLMDGSREYVTLDDMEERGLAKRDTTMFLQMHSTPIMIDEVQHAPELFSYIKIQIDTCFSCNCRKMQHGICGTTKRHIDSQGIHKCFFRHNITGFDILFH